GSSSRPRRCAGTQRRAPRVPGRRSDGDALLVRFEGAGDGDAALDVRAELCQRQLDGGERRGDVEDVEPADVTDAEDLALQAALPRRESDTVPIAQMAQEL